MTKYREYNEATAKMLDGIFGFVLYNRDVVMCILLNFYYLVCWLTSCRLMVLSEVNAYDDCKKLNCFLRHSIISMIKTLPRRDTFYKSGY